VSTHRVCLVFSTIQFMAVVENVFVGRVEASLHTVLHYLAGTRRTLKLLDLEKKGSWSIQMDNSATFHIEGKFKII